MNENHIQQLESQVREIQERNKRVEADKAWETSWVRMISIAIITYIIAGLVMYSIGVKNVFLNAFIPTIGFVLSVQSLPFLKKWWIAKYYRNT